MSKTSAKNVRNALRRIGVYEKTDENISMFASPVMNYQISLPDIQIILDEHPGYNNFQLLKDIVDDIIKVNQTNHLALFACFELLNKYAADYGNLHFKLYSELAMLHHFKMEVDWRVSFRNDY
jgi:hypothetical protein